MAHRFRSRHCKITADVEGTTDMSLTNYAPQAGTYRRRREEHCELGY